MYYQITAYRSCLASKLLHTQTMKLRILCTILELLTLWLEHSQPNCCMFSYSGGLSAYADAITGGYVEVEKAS